MNRIITFILILTTSLYLNNAFCQSQNASQIHTKAISSINDNNQENDSIAIEMFKEALTLNHTQSARYLGMMYWFGKGVEKDRREAQKYFYMADCFDIDRYNAQLPDSVAPRKVTNKAFSYFFIRVTSIHNGSNSKIECHEIINTINSQYPHLCARLEHEPPYWRINAGYFQTREEANAMVKRIKKAYPQYRNATVFKSSTKYRK